MSNTIVGSIFLNESKARCARAATYGEIILATGDLGMPPERAFRALTTDEVEKWWSSARTCRVTDWKAEFRVDGRWSLIRRLTDGTRLPAGGSFWRSSRRTKSSRRESTNRTIRSWGVARRRSRIVLAARNRTRRAVRHEGFAGLLAAATEDVAGWERGLAGRVPDACDSVSRRLGFEYRCMFEGA